MKIIHRGKTKTGKEIIVRYPQPGDEQEMCRYINELSREKTFVRFQGEEVLLKDELEYLNAQLRKVEAKKAITLLVFTDNKLIAISDINMLDKTEKHLGLFAISVAKDFRGEGIGKLLIELIIKEAQKEIADLKIVTLDVYQKNSIAQNLYTESGFVKYGILPNGVIRNDLLEDRILMYKNVS
jgi:ribosomal protein S18 acetylase RimI-like enzyme